MDKELHQLQQVFKNSDVLVQKCGIGKVNAALGAQRMINEFHPDCIISSGCAGGNGDDINVQDVVISTELCYHDVYCGTAIDNTTQVYANAGIVRRKVLEYLGFLGITMDAEANKKRGETFVLSTPDSKVKVIVLPTNEELSICRETVRLVKG